MSVSEFVDVLLGTSVTVAVVRYVEVRIFIRCVRRHDRVACV